MAQDINTINANPDQTFISDNAGARVFTDSCNSGRAYTSTTGKRLVGLADPQQGEFNLKPDLESIMAGAQATSLEELVKGWSGSGNFTFQDLNPQSLELQVGSTASVLTDTQPSSPVTGNIASSGSTMSSIKMATGQAANFSSYVGQPVLISSASGTKKLRGWIKSVNTSTEVIALQYELDELPAASGTVTLLDGYTQEIGGNYMLQSEVIFAQDFGKGGSHRTVLWRTQPVGGYKRTLANGNYKTSVELKIQGHTRTVNSLAQQIPMTTYAKYGTVSFN